MKFTTKAFVLCALLGSAFGVGCGSSSQQQQPDLAPFLQQEDLSTPKMCVMKCASDADCQNSCPTPSSGIKCCDLTTNICYTSQQQVCPVPPDLSVVGPY